MHDDDLSLAAVTSAARRARTWSQRHLSTGVTALIWALRLYVVGMLAVIVVQLTRLV